MVRRPTPLPNGPRPFLAETSRSHRRSTRQPASAARPSRRPCSAGKRPLRVPCARRNGTASYGRIAPRRWKRPHIAVPDRIGAGLKIPVSAVRFCPCPPSSSRNACRSGDSDGDARRQLTVGCRRARDPRSSSVPRRDALAVRHLHAIHREGVVEHGSTNRVHHGIIVVVPR